MLSTIYKLHELYENEALKRPTDFILINIAHTKALYCMYWVMCATTDEMEARLLSPDKKLSKRMP